MARALRSYNLRIVPRELAHHRPSYTMSSDTSKCAADIIEDPAIVQRRLELHSITMYVRGNSQEVLSLHEIPFGPLG